LSQTVLVVEDDSALRSLIAESLMDARYSVVKAADGKSAIQSFHEFKPDVAILDIGLNDISGLELCRQIRSYRNIPIIFLTARDSEVDQLLGFATGADDYITKPFSPKLLNARIDAITRRKSGPDVEKSRYVVGPVELDVERRTFKVNNELVPLTRREFDILQTLIASPDRAVSRDELIKNAWGDWYGDTHMIECHVSRIRSKVKKAGGPHICQAVHGVGYRLGIKEVQE
jgi:DNA-binding response OmpR family regulator